MKKIIMLTMVFVMMLVSLGGCYVGFEGGDRDGGYNRGADHDRDGGYNRGSGHDGGGGHDKNGDRDKGGDHDKGGDREGQH